jgi:hypothetical protein
MLIAKGERFRVVQPLKRAALVYFAAPFTGGFECTLATGTVLAVAQDSGPEKNTVLLVPEEREPFERTWLTEEERKDPKYLGFAFPFKKSDIEKHLASLPSPATDS